MATAKKLKSGSWRCLVYDYTDANGKRKYKSFTCEDKSAKGKRKCEAMAADYAMNKTAIQNSKDDTIFSDALSRYIESRKVVLSPATIRGYMNIQSVLKKDYQSFMNIRVCEIKNDDIQDLVNNISRKKSPKTVRNYIGLISSVLKKKLIIDITLPQSVPPAYNIPSDEIIQKVINLSAGTEIEIPILLGAFCMMRRGEICGLDIRDLGPNNVLHIHHSRVLGYDNEIHIKSPKTESSDRYIKIPDFIANKIREKGYITNILPNTITKEFIKLLKRNKIPSFRFHDLRHYSASSMHAMGIPDAYIMERGGWSSDKVLKGVYRHTLNDREKEMNDKTNDYFSELCNTKCNTK